MAALTKYELKAWHEIEAWKDKGQGRFSRALAPVTAKLAPVAGRVVPTELVDTVEKSILGFVAMLSDGANWTFRTDGILHNAAKVGIEVGDIADLQRQDLEKLDKLSRRYMGENKYLAALEGGACGLGGMALIAADIPALFTIAFRSVQQIGGCYGFDMQDPVMRPVVMHAFSAGTAASSSAKAAAIADMRVAAIAYSKNWTYQKVSERTATGVVAQAAKTATKKLPRDIAKNVTKRKLAQFIPLVGGAVGAGYNYWFLNQTTLSAYMMFRDLYLYEKHGDLAAHIVDAVVVEASPADGAVQCSAMTASGSRCRRRTRDASGRCHQHRA